MDDMGYSDVGCFGGEIDTPHIDALAARGIRFNHYTTHPICSPARAALLTGRNAHSVSTGWLANNNGGFPGYSGEIPKEAPTLAETLRAQGYGTMMVGKWHNTPTVQSFPSSPKDSWPTQRGFDWFYGFMEGETNFFFPARLMMGNTLLPIDAYAQDFYTTDAWMDKAIEFVREHRTAAPDKPFFLYVANNAVHAPLQAKAADLAKYRGRYAAGWTALREARHRRQLEMGIIPPGTRLADSDPGVRPWHTLSAEDQAFFARHMEAYAAMLDCADQNIGRLTAYLRDSGQIDNTIIVFTSDNGGTFAGGPIGSFRNNRRYSGLPLQPIEEERKNIDLLGTPQSEALYPVGWGQVCNTPFPSSKTYTGGGGRRVSFILSWPARFAGGGAIRPQFAHVTDVKPTLLELAGLKTLDTLHPHGVMNSTTNAGPTVPTTATGGSRARCKSAAKPSTWTTGRCITSIRIFPRAWTCARSTPGACASWLMRSTKRRGKTWSTRSTTATWCKSSPTAQHAASRQARARFPPARKPCIAASSCR
jgi:arylsulfatase